MTAQTITLAVILAAAPAAVRAHDGPPFPILSDRLAGPYTLSIWTDPDATDDGSAGGQFWVRLQGSKSRLPDATRVTVSVRPLDRSGAELTAQAAPVRGDVTNQFAALVMDHEGPFAVRVTVEGPLGSAAADAAADATYDLRPAPYLVILYAAPFVLVGILWGALMVRRRGASRARRLDIHS
jgi:hypothetical protein